MPMTVVVTNGVPARYRGFLASAMCEIAPGVYTAPSMTKRVREQVWGVCTRWFPLGAPYWLVMTWPDRKSAGGQQILTLGQPSYDMVQLFATQVVRRPLTENDHRSLTKKDEKPVPF